MSRRLTLATLACLLPATATAAASPSAPAHYSRGTASPSLTRLVTALGAPASAAADARFAYLRKLEGGLQDAAAARLDGRRAEPAAALSPASLGGSGRVSVDVYVTGAMTDAQAALRDAGMAISATSDTPPERMVEGTVPVSALPGVAGLASTRAVMAVEGTGTNTGGTLSQGDAAHHGPQARALGATGTGVTVGVISDSINQVGSGIAGSQASGDLPGPASTPPGQVTVLQDKSGGSDEGRAMSEIIFDEAPGIRNLLFTSGGLGAATRAAGIDNLVAQGAKVIADDTFQITEPFFQDGVVAQAVDRARAAGVAYFVSAGNRARQSWEGTYAPTADPRAVSPDTNDFDPSAATDAIQTIGTFTNRNLFLELQWDEPVGQATTNLALDFYTITAGTPTYAFSVDSDNVASGIPAEFANVNVSGTATVGVAIRRVAGARTPFMKYVVGNAPTFTIAEHNTNSDAIDPDASSARGAITVGASNYSSPASPEIYSSRGPAFKLFDKDGNRLAAPDVRPKPDIDAADQVATSVPGFNPFGGTSAAAPSAAGIAALMLSANPALPIAETQAILQDTSHTIDCTATAGIPDSDCGYGFELADGAVAQAMDSTPPAVTPVLSPAAPNGANGYYTTPAVGVTWSTTDPGSPVATTNGCGPATVTTDGPTTLTCSATSAGGTTTTPLIVKRDSTPPTAPGFSGIAAQSYQQAKLPAAAAVGCAAADPTSGAGCAVTGYDSAVGPHVLTAVATNGAGLTSTATLAYRVLADPAAISRLSVSRKAVRVKGVLRSGVALAVRATARSTRLKVALVLGGHVIGSATKTVQAGAVRLHVKLSKAGRARLGKHPGKITVKVSGRAAGTSAKTLTAGLKTKR